MIELNPQLHQTQGLKLVSIMQDMIPDTIPSNISQNLSLRGASCKKVITVSIPKQPRILNMDKFRNMHIYKCNCNAILSITW
jgi:hypothetical protein